jgi:hypothetical protein
VIESPRELDWTSTGDKYLHFPPTLLGIFADSEGNFLSKLPTNQNQIQRQKLTPNHSFTIPIGTTFSHDYFA